MVFHVTACSCTAGLSVPVVQLLVTMTIREACKKVSNGFLLLLLHCHDYNYLWVPYRRIEEADVDASNNWHTIDKSTSESQRSIDLQQHRKRERSSIVYWLLDVENKTVSATACNHRSRACCKVSIEESAAAADFFTRGIGIDFGPLKNAALKKVSSTKWTSNNVGDRHASLISESITTWLKAGEQRSSFGWSITRMESIIRRRSKYRLIDCHAMAFLVSCEKKMGEMHWLIDWLPDERQHAR